MARSTAVTPEAAAALVEEATKRAGLVWVGLADDEPREVVWHVWHEGSAYVLTGPGEQPDPGFGEVPLATVAVPSKDKRSRLVVWIAVVERIAPDTPTWTSAVAAIAPKRLNLPDGEAAPARWAATCRLYRLTPTGDVVPADADPRAPSGSAPPLPTTATTPVRRPFQLGRRRR